MKFHYKARTKEGETQFGIIEASSKEAAVALLQRHNLFVISLEEEKVPFYAKELKIFRRISKKDIVTFTRQLSVMFKSEVSLVEALDVLASQIKNRDFKEIIVGLSEEVKGGTSLSQALSRYPNLFTSFYCSMVRSGEVSGTLSESLDYLAEHLEREHRLEGQMKGAMVYPAIVTFMILLVVTLVLVFVIPRLTEVLTETQQELPAITLAVISVSNFLKHWGWLILIVIGALIFFLISYSKTPEGKKFFDKTFLKIPLIKDFLKMVYLSRFAENLSTLIKGGLPIARALEVTSDVVGNAVYKDIILEAREEVRRGETISSVLFRFPDSFPPVFSQMVLVGEKTGTIDKTLMDVVRFYREEVNRGITNLLNILEPLLIVFLGVVVALIMAAVLLPLYQTAAL